MNRIRRWLNDPKVGVFLGLGAALVAIVCSLVFLRDPHPPKTITDLGEPSSTPSQTHKEHKEHKESPPVYDNPAPADPDPSETVAPPAPKPVSPPAKPSTPPPIERRLGPIDSLVDQLKVADEHNDGYNREAFGSRAPTASTRDDLITQEKRSDGKWLSIWDGKIVNDPSVLDADHTVALGETWGSGAYAWTDEKRESYANDLSDPYVLNLISAPLNRGPKSDNDPFEWMPETNTCEYVREWTLVKLDWGLTADGEEKMALHNQAEECDK